MSPRMLVRLVTRIAVVVAIVGFLGLAGLQYARVLGRNLALAHELDAVRGDVATLERRRDAQRREIKRLSDPAGAIPEIHDELHLVRGDEAIIYLKGRPSPAPSAALP